ncbi:hypothetical protein F5879DRAFT_952231 [Lentinula edodes]|nr:hypothetical protein F5879DRAFT_952231 [Lentinula edodes]
MSMAALSSTLLSIVVQRSEGSRDEFPHFWPMTVSKINSDIKVKVLSNQHPVSCDWNEGTGEGREGRKTHKEKR